MKDNLKPVTNLPPEQQAIRDKCFHPSGTFVEFPIEDVETSIPARFEKTVRMYPNHLGFKIADQAATYAEINALANQFARDLVDKLGVGSETVGILLDNGVELLAATFGILKAGKSVVSVDLNFPKERAKAIFAELQVRLIVTDAIHKSLARTLCEQAATLTIDSSNPSLAVENLNLSIPTTAPAFLIYTSGSTGAPKSVIHNHRSRLYGVMERANAFHLSHNDRVSLLTSGTANAIGNSLRTLLSGASLHAFDVKKYGVAALAKWLLEEKITVCSIGVSLFREFCKTHTGEEPFRDLRILGLRSESVLNSDVELYKEHFPPSCLLVNGITVSEAGLLAMYFVDHHTEVCGHEVPVGYAVKDKDISLIDDDGEDVGFNRVGEIVVRSRYLYPGYWNNSDLTTAKFKTDPQDPDKLIYRTGDLGLMLPDGCLIHKGRKDFRLKIRGYGVDIVEAEDALRSHPAVKDAILVGRQYEMADTRLIAYFTSSIESGPTTSELRQYLSNILADYMIPSAFIRLDVLPVTLTGKVDRRALPDPDRRRPDLDNPFVAPRTHVEKTVAQIVSECTGIEPVGIEDNFFDLGGDSLTLARLVSRVSAAFERDIPVQDLYESASVAGIARWLEAAASSSQFISEPPLPTASDSPRELSFSQQRLWFLDQLHPTDPLYNLLTAFQITGRLNIDALERTLNQVVARHEVLRTVFDSVDGRPGLKLLHDVTLAIPVIDLEEAGSLLEGDVLLKQHCADLVRQPFNLSQGPLIRVSLLRQSDDRHVLVIVAHHIVFDGWSMGVLWHELAVGYQALCQGQPASLPKLAVQYADYAHWQRDRLQQDRLQNQLQYWRQQLNGISRLQLPTDRPRPLNQASKGAKRHFILSAELSAKLKLLSHDHGTTLFMTLMAVFQTLLHRYTSQDDIAIGCPVAGRNRSEVENLIGFFLNIIVFRTDISGEPSFVELLERVRQVCLGAYAHQDLPFEKLVEELRPERQLNRNPLVDVTFVFQNTPYVAPQFYEASVSQLEIDNGIARFELQLFMEETGGQLRGYFSYSTDLFDEPTIARMAEHFLNLIEGIVANPNRRIGELQLLTETERQQLLVEWNGTQRDYAKDECIHELFENQVERTPGAIAVTFEDQQLTYRELNDRANQLGHYLQNLGVKPDALVGICMERSADMIVGLLGILKAGGSYVPLDPSYPAERLEFMLADAQISVLLTQEGLFEDGGSRMDDSDRRSSIHDRPMQRICLDRDWALIARESDANPESAITADDLAYVIYTSGSTGQPKGVQIKHESLLNLVFWHHLAFSITPTDRATQLAGSGFDAAVWELWPYLTIGASIHIPAEINRRDAESLRDWLVAQAITISFVPTTFAESLVALEWPHETALRTLLTGGDTLHVYPPETLPFRVFNNYGPTECTVVTTSAQVWPNAHPLHPPTIGWPIANRQVYILDAHRNPAPIGVVGEIYIGGDGLARGYLNQTELTAEKFIEYSFRGEPAKRLYRTGDYGRYLADGNIEFLGRIDNQVKIRGYRIELGEIEATLGQHPSIKESVVLAREESPGDRRLVAYVVVAPGSVPSVTELRGLLQQKLPEYMVPSAFVFLDAMPLTPNGKLDRKALPAPDQSRPELEQSFVAPRTPVEEVMAGIWGEVLKLERVGIHDNFFDLGGHSLLATQVMSRLREALRVDLPLRALFEAPTIVELALRVERGEAGGEEFEGMARHLAEVESLSEEESERRLAEGNTQERRKTMKEASSSHRDCSWRRQR